MDKVQKIKEWISKEQEGLMDAQGNFEYPSDEGAFHVLSRLDHYIDSLQEEPINEKLEEAADNALNKVLNIHEIVNIRSCLEMFRFGANWQKEQMMAKAIDAHCFGFQDAALFSFRLPANNYLVGSKVKVIVIKKD